MDPRAPGRWLVGVLPVTCCVCTGALVLCAAGLLKVPPATTHWAAPDELRTTDPSIDIRDDVRWIDDGDRITASGVSAVIDMALHLIIRLAGAKRAVQVKHAIQYEPQPPI